MHGETMSPIQRWLYAGACVLLPVVWGLAIVWVTDRIERRIARRRGHHDQDAGGTKPPPTLEYHI